MLPAPPCTVPPRPAVYRRRRPERTVLYQVVQHNLETWLTRRQAADAEGGGVPRWGEGELRRYLECGILAHGFARARCAECGHDFLVAFSCCPEWETMWSVALLPDERLRGWVR